MPITSTTVAGSLGDRIDDALDPSCEDVALVTALLREIKKARFKHPGVQSLEVKCMGLEARAAEADGSGQAAATPDKVDVAVERMRKMSMASQQRLASQRATEEAAMFKPDIGRSSQMVGQRRGSIFDRMDEDTDRTRKALAEQEKSILVRARSALWPRRWRRLLIGSDWLVLGRMTSWRRPARRAWGRTSRRSSSASTSSWPTAHGSAPSCASPRPTIVG